MHLSHQMSSIFRCVFWFHVNFLIFQFCNSLSKYSDQVLSLGHSCFCKHDYAFYFCTGTIFQQGVKVKNQKFYHVTWYADFHKCHMQFLASAPNFRGSPDLLTQPSRARVSVRPRLCVLYSSHYRIALNIGLSEVKAHHQRLLVIHHWVYLHCSVVAICQNIFMQSLHIGTVRFICCFVSIRLYTFYSFHRTQQKYCKYCECVGFLWSCVVTILAVDILVITLCVMQ